MSVLDNEGSSGLNFAYRHLFVWVTVWAFHTSHPWSDDKALVLTHRLHSHGVEATILKG